MPEILSSFLLPTTTADRIHDLRYESRAHVKLLRFLAKNVNSDTNRLTITGNNIDKISVEC